MGISTELKIDKDRCKNCGCLLSENIKRKRPSYTLYEYDSTLYYALVYHITCSKCNHVNEIFYIGQPISELLGEFEEKADFGCVPAI